MVGPLALAASAGTGLVIDLLGGMATGSRRTVADLIAEGPRLEELSPGRSGVAMMGAGPVSADQFRHVVERLAESWPALVIRAGEGQWEGRLVPAIPLFPGWLSPVMPGAAVWQPVAGMSKAPGPGPVLPRLTSRTAKALLSGKLPIRSRWISAWRPVWGMPWA